MKMNKVLREQNETIVKTVSTDNRIPSALISQIKSNTKDNNGVFTQAKKADIVNEKRPVI